MSGFPGVWKALGEGEKAGGGRGLKTGDTGAEEAEKMRNLLT